MTSELTLAPALPSALLAVSVPSSGLSWNCLLSTAFCYFASVSCSGAPAVGAALPTVAPSLAPFGPGTSIFSSDPLGDFCCSAADFEPLPHAIPPIRRARTTKRDMGSSIADLGGYARRAAARVNVEGGTLDERR